MLRSELLLHSTGMGDLHVVVEASSPKRSEQFLSLLDSGNESPQVNTLRKINTELSGGLDSPVAGAAGAGGGAEHGDASDRAAALLAGKEAAALPGASEVSGARKVKGRLRENSNSSRRNMGGSRSPTSDVQGVDSITSRMAWESSLLGHEVDQQGVVFEDGPDWQGARNAVEVIVSKSVQIHHTE